MACAANRVYHQNAFGAVISCPCNNAIQLQFGNVALLFLPEEFKQVHAHLAEIAADYPSQAAPEDLTILVKTPVQSLVFLFKPQELHALLELTCFTCLLLEVDKMLQV